ncbi:MAG: hypothetical protein RL188_460 [Bacteroidota bacterium]|jgi:uncharacterized membrane protein
MENKTKALIKKGMLYGMIAFYIFGGYNHFRDPAFYIPLIPPYLGAWAVELNLLSGVFEIGLALLLIPQLTRKWAGWGIVIMLFAFIPSHIYFIEKGNFSLGSFTMTPFISWIRLLVFQPLFILWALWVSRK